MAQGTAVITGKVVDAASKAPIADVVVTATSPALQGEQIMVTDATGSYRIPQLPAGQYTLRLEKEGYKPYARSDISLRTDRTTRVNVELLPEALSAEEIVVVGAAPTIDVGASSTGVNVGTDFINNIAVVRPGGKGSATRSFESLAEVAPGAHVDAYGVSVNGTTSPENAYVIDGLSVNDPGYGILGTPLTVEFVKEVNVITGGYMPEYGRSTGGIMNVVTKTGSNEFHGSVFGNFTPGALQGDSPVVQREGSVVYNDIDLWNQGDFGAELGGPILKDKLWFYAGFAPAFGRERIDRHYYSLDVCTDEDFATGAAGCRNVARDDQDQLFRKGDNGLTQVTEFEGMTERYFADQKTFQYIGKLTYLINQDHNLTLSVYGAPTSSGGEGTFGIDPQDGTVEIGPTTAGEQTFLGHRYKGDSNDVALKYSGAFADKRILLDVTGGWHHQVSSRLPSDGSELGTTEGLAGQQSVHFRRTKAFDSDPDSPTFGAKLRDFHSLAEFKDFAGEELCAQTLSDGTVVNACPVNVYFRGGPDFLQSANLDRFQGKGVLTFLANAAGHHVIKAGVDAETLRYENDKAYSGLLRWRETTNGNFWDTIRMYGYVTGPATVDSPGGQAIIQRHQLATSTSNTIGGFVQDSWSVMDLFTINAGVRYDQQTLIGDDNKVGMRLANQWSPRVGVIYDFTQEGRSKIYANYARFYESVPLDLVDRQFPGERTLFGRYRAEKATTAGCNPVTEAPTGESDCSLGTEQDGQVVVGPAQYRRPLDPGSPNPDWIIVGGEKSSVDPDIKPQSSDEIVAGAEYEVIPDARIGASYTKRYMNSVIEDMSRDEANTYFIGNPGEGIAKDFPKATRDYDAVTVYFDKTFSDLWLAQLSYTWAHLRGNYAGLFRPETGQLDPNINSDFDLISLLDNRTGDLPGDRRHSIKLFAAKEFVLTGAMSLNLGLSYRARSGTPLNYFGSHAIYGADEVFILPRGTGGRLPWRHEVDGHLGYNLKLSKDNVVTVSMDVFNLFNFAGVASVDQRYTNADVLPIPSDATGTNDEKLNQLVYAEDGTPFNPQDINPNFKNVTSYQAPRIFRFGAKVTF